MNATYNPALQSSFRLEIPGLKTVNYAVQRVELPSVTLDSIPAPFRNHQGNLPDNRIVYDQLNLDFLVSEDYSNRQELQLWLHRLEKSPDPMLADLKDITLHLTTSTNNAGLAVVFYHAFPVMVGGIPLDAGSTDETPLVCSCSFAYSYYEIIHIEA